MMGWLEDPVCLCLLVIGYSLELGADFDTRFIGPDEEIDIVELEVDHVFEVYGGVKSSLKLLNMFVPPASSLDVFRKVAQKGDEQCSLLGVKQTVLLEWLQRPSVSLS